MNNADIIVLGIVEEALGSNRTTKAENPQKYFNCKSPKCKHDHNKYNLAYHAESKIFKCWKCKIHGSVFTLIKSYGSKVLLEKLKLALPYYNQGNDFSQKQNVDYESITCELPSEYLPLWIPRDSFKYKNALDYMVNERKVTIEEIEQLKIGYTEEGTRKLRIIIPSYNKNGTINYYEARSYWKKMRQTYMKPDNPDKDDIIFNEKNINWDLPVFLVEGVFDSIRIPNSIPMLGKIPSSLIMMNLLNHQSRVVLCLDEDALTDCYELFNTLSSLGLDVYYIDMTGSDDISRVYEKKGKDGILDLMKRIQKLSLNTYMEKTLKYINNE